MNRYKIQRRVSVALNDIYEYSLATWGEAQADNYVLGFFDIFAAIASRQIIWRPVPVELGTDGFRYRYEHHWIYWLLGRDGTVIIYAVLHERMHQHRRLKEFDGDPDLNG